MSDSRTRILAHLRQAPQERLRPIPSADVSEPTDTTALIEQFRSRMEAVHGEVRVSGRDDWLDAVIQILDDHQVGRLWMSAETWPGRDIRDRLPANVSLVSGEGAGDQWKHQLFHEVDAALTGCLGAIAETGSLALWPSQAEPRLMSLVPPLHIVILEAERIAATFDELIREQNWAAQMPTNALLISGPSKSADIEQVLAYGVHGPKALVVLILT
ncbi:MAG: lactate utilization protein [Candidatus Thiodiazotropha sp.]